MSFSNLPCHIFIRAHVLGVTLLLFGLRCISGSAGTNYYVSTTGSDAVNGLATTNAWRSIQHAVENVGPGDTVYVLSGTYTGALIQASGTAEAPITLMANPGDLVILNQEQPYGGTSKNSIILLEDYIYGASVISNWVIQGFEITGAGRDGIDLRRTSRITIRSNYVHHCGNRGIMTFLSDDTVIEGNECSYSSAQHGIYCSDSGDRPSIRNNICHHCTGAGIQINAGTDGLGDGVTSGAIIEGNTCYENGLGAGINLGGVADSMIRNNLIYLNNNGSGIALYEDPYSLPSVRNKVYNNTILRDVEGSGRWGITISHVSCVSNELLNNIIYNYHGTDGSINLAGLGIPGFVSDYNVIMDRFSVTDGAAIISLAIWQSYGYDAHSFIADPSNLFVNVAGDDYHLSTNSPAIDAGIELLDVVRDLEGARRPQGLTQDIGCYELTSDLFRVVATAHSGGGIVPAGVSLVEPGSNITFGVTADSGYRAVSVVTDLGSSMETNHGPLESYTFVNIQTNNTIDAFFTNTFSVTPAWSGDGGISPATVVTTDIGGALEFTVQAGEHAHVEALRIGNVYVGYIEDTNRLTALSLTWSNVTANDSLDVSFSENTWAHGTPESWLGGYYPGTTDYEVVTTGDTDGDGFAAWEERLTGTSPTDLESRFQIIGHDQVEGANVLRWLGGTNGSQDPFLVERLTNLVTHASWELVRSLAKSPTGTNEWRDTNAPQGAAFYRISVTN
ncbi:MAG: right-handed parallel beta-helix repeat-containing protein [Kiritimatiellia bacterium]|nr:right-handed parallel beta-helix repeat-containing protein [Kiritimatiellia bacterium]